MSNYSGVVTKIKNIRQHTNADRLLCTNIMTNNVIVGLGVKEGDIGIFFPVECQLSQEFCNANDLIRRKDENGKPAGGMFEANRRIRCMSLRGEKSMGFWCPISYLEKWAGYCKFELPFLKEGDEIDKVFNHELCRKYEPLQSNKSSKQAAPKLPRVKFLPGQFSFHFNTSPLWKNGSNLHPDDIVSVTEKLHGSAFIVANLLVNRKLSLLEHIAKFFGAKVVESEYKEIAASRAVVKTNNPRPGFYSEDLWSNILDTMFTGRLKQGETVYGEVVNQSRSGKWIQENYTYGFPKSTPGVFIYRITQTSPDGNTIELSWPQVKARALELGHPTVPELFYGPLKDIFPLDYSNPEWYDLFLEQFYARFAPDIECPLCNTGVAREGGVLRIEGPIIKNYKAKSSLFLKGESISLDKGETGIDNE